jgi:hypothetical protein
MSAPLRDPKELTEWLELDYADRPRGLRRWTRRLVWAALGLAVLFALYALWPRHHTVFEAGPVSAAHAMFNNNCAACHDESFQTAARLWPTAHDARSVSDDKCLQCHDGPHHNRLVLANEPNCAACHREHRGRPALARVPDAHCTSCHSDLRGHYPRSAFEDVSGFPDGHPNFRWWDGHNDPGTVAFNHKVHLVEGGVLTRGLPERRTLRCENCHQPDEAGRYIKPIRYEHHCQECHPLSVQVTGQLAGTRLQKAAAEFGNKPAPHREPDVVRAALRDRYTEFAQQFKDELFPDLPPGAKPEVSLLPWRPLPPPLSKQEWDWAQVQVNAVERALFTRGGGCAYCHALKTEWKSGEGKGPNVLPQYQPSDLNTRRFELPNGKSFVSDRWLPNSHFNHAPHRMLQCTACHRGAEESSQTRDVLIPVIKDCKSCHTPQAGARSDCVECHHYHPREGHHVRSVEGASRQTGTRTIEEILRMNGR